MIFLKIAILTFIFFGGFSFLFFLKLEKHNHNEVPREPPLRAVFKEDWVMKDITLAKERDWAPVIQRNEIKEP